MKPDTDNERTISLSKEHEITIEDGFVYIKFKTPEEIQQMAHDLNLIAIDWSCDIDRTARIKAIQRRIR